MTCMEAKPESPARISNSALCQQTTPHRTRPISCCGRLASRQRASGLGSEDCGRAALYKDRRERQRESHHPMHGLFAYFNLATVLMMAISQAVEVFKKRPVEGQALSSAVMPVINAITLIRPHT